MHLGGTLQRRNPCRRIFLHRGAIQAIEENANFAWSQNFGHKNATWMHTDRRSIGLHAASRNLTFYWSLREEECHGDIKT